MILWNLPYANTALGLPSWAAAQNPQKKRGPHAQMQNVRVLKRASSTLYAGKKKLNKKLAKRDWLAKIGAMQGTIPSSNTTTNSTVMIKYAQKTNHVAKKIAPGHYLYRGWTIKRFDYGTLGDPECNSVEWNIFAPGEENWNDSVPTLSFAKRRVNTRIEQGKQRASAS